jgi:tetratricopeptide (TPR) repeat protein
MARRSLAPLFVAACFAGLAAPPAMAAPHNPSDARGASSDSPERRRALELFEESARAYREGRFQDAVDKLLEARRAKAEPVLLYNLARAYEALGKPQEAADAYQSYLQEEPNASDKKAIEGKITTLRQQAAELAAARKPDATPPPPPPGTTPAPAPQPPPQPVPEPEGATLYLPWIIAGAGVALIGTGFVFGGIAKGRHNDAVDEPSQQAAANMQDDAEAYARASTITIAAGAVIALVGAGWLVLRATTTSSTTGSAPQRRSSMPSWGWTF